MFQEILVNINSNQLNNNTKTFEQSWEDSLYYDSLKNELVDCDEEELDDTSWMIF